jgi:hypothetical protein
MLRRQSVMEELCLQHRGKAGSLGCNSIGAMFLQPRNIGARRTIRNVPQGQERAQNCTTNVEAQGQVHRSQLICAIKEPGAFILRCTRIFSHKRARLHQCRQGSFTYCRNSMRLRQAKPLRSPLLLAQTSCCSREEGLVSDGTYASHAYL